MICVPNGDVLSEARITEMIKHMDGISSGFFTKEMTAGRVLSKAELPEQGRNHRRIPIHEHGCTLRLIWTAAEAAEARRPRPKHGGPRGNRSMRGHP